jgi:phage shock protein C
VTREIPERDPLGKSGTFRIPFLTSPAHPGDMENIHASFARQGFTRTRHHRLLGGVCAGLGRRLGLGPWSARLVFLLILCVVPGSQLLVYPLLWILMPEVD